MLSVSRHVAKGAAPEVAYTPHIEKLVYGITRLRILLPKYFSQFYPHSLFIATNYQYYIFAVAQVLYLSRNLLLMQTVLGTRMLYCLRHLGPHIEFCVRFK